MMHSIYTFSIFTIVNSCAATNAREVAFIITKKIGPLLQYCQEPEEKRRRQSIEVVSQAQHLKLQKLEQVALLAENLVSFFAKQICNCNVVIWKRKVFRIYV